MKKKAFILIVCILACELIGYAGSRLVMPNIAAWYATLNKPALDPPDFVFALVWTALFALMGVSLFLTWQKAGEDKKTLKMALASFIVQLVANVLWTAIFFGTHNPLGAFIDIIFLWLLIVWTMIVFWEISKPAAWLLVPYLAWVTFAAYLNYAIIVLN